MLDLPWQVGHALVGTAMSKLLPGSATVQKLSIIPRTGGALWASPTFHPIQVNHLHSKHSTARLYSSAQHSGQLRKKKVKILFTVDASTGHS